MVYTATAPTSNPVKSMESPEEAVQIGEVLNVCIVEDNDSYRNSIELLIKTTTNLSLTGSYPHCEALLRKNVTFSVDSYPDVLLLDINFKRSEKRTHMTGIEGLAKIKAKFTGVAVLMLTDYDAADYIFNALQQGASGYLHKSSSVKDITDAITMASRGGMILPPAIASKMRVLFQGVDVSSEQALSKREMEIVELMAKGQSRKDIAKTLYISPNTVDSHLNKIYQKLHVSTGTAAIAKIYGARSPLKS
ncbi:MAG: response regulator transcription factor [Bacteroidota bacterium]